MNKSLLLALTVLSLPLLGKTTTASTTTTAKPTTTTAATKPVSTTTATKPAAATGPCAIISTKPSLDCAKEQLTKSDALNKVLNVVNGVTSFVNDTVPLLERLPDIAKDTFNCANAKPDDFAAQCKNLTKDNLDKAKLGMPQIKISKEKESRYAFALYTFSSMLTKLGDGFFAKIEKGKLKGGLLISFFDFLTYAQPQLKLLSDARAKLGDVRIDIESLRKALKYMADGLKYAAEQSQMNEAAKKAKEDDPFSAEPISFEEEAPAMEAAPEEAPAEEAPAE